MYDTDIIQVRRNSFSHTTILVALLLILPSISVAAWAVYADSWDSPTRAQTQAFRINRRINVTTATYERATVRGRVFWRVRVGVYAKRAEARSIRARLKKSGITDTWMREVSSRVTPAQPVPQPPAVKPAQDSIHVDTIVQSLIDSLALISRRRVDSLDTATQQHLQNRLAVMRLHVKNEVIRQIEANRVRDRRTFVTRSEQTQMTQALLDEMNANLVVLRDSLRVARERRHAG